MNIQSIASTAPGNGTMPVVAAHPNAHESTVVSPEAQLSKTAVVTQQAPPPPQETKATREQLDEAVKAVSAFVKSVNNSLQFTVDDNSGKTVIKVLDSNTKEIIRQIPSEEMLTIAKALDGIKGLLVQQKA